MRKKNIICEKGKHKFITNYILKNNYVWRVNECKYCFLEFQAREKRLQKKLIFSNILREKEREQKK